MSHLLAFAYSSKICMYILATSKNSFVKFLFLFLFVMFFIYFYPLSFRVHSSLANG